MKEKKVIAYKGFDENLCCRGFQYEIGKEYEQEGEIVCCSNGFHACSNPFDVFEHYKADRKNRFCKVLQYGTIKSCEGDTKQSSSKIKIISEIGVAGIFNAGVEWIKEKTNPAQIIEKSKYGINNSIVGYDNISSCRCYAQIGSSGGHVLIGSSGYSAQIGSVGNFAQIGSSGNFAQIGSSGDFAQIGSSGNKAQIGSSGDNAYIGLCGDYAQIGSSGDYAYISSSGICTQIGSSGDHARIGSCGIYALIGSSGDRAQISSSGEYAQISSSGICAKISSSGDYANICSTGEDSVICCAGNSSIVKAKKGSWITLSERKYSEDKKRFVPVCVKTEFVDGERIKEDTWYRLVDGEFKEQKSE